MTSDKHKWRTDMRRAVEKLTATIPTVLKLERDLAIALATERRLIGENDKLREQNATLRKMVIAAQLSRSNDAHPRT